MKTAHRPGAITFLALADIALAAGYILGIPNAAIVLRGCACGPSRAELVLALCGVILTLAHLFAAVGLLARWKWGLRLQVVLTGVDLLLPCWTAGGIVYLLYLRRPAVEAIFGGEGPQPADPAAGGAANGTDMSRAGRMVAACMLPSLTLFVLVGVTPVHIDCRTMRNEAATIGDIRTIIAAEAAYQRRNSGAYDSPACLASPASCIPGFAAEGTAFLDPDLATRDTRSGYSRTFHAGPRVPSERTSPTSVKTFAYVAVPTEPGRSGCRAFCGDSTATICYTPDGSMPSVTGGLCDLRTCEPLP
jgi:hypothetical protein